MCVYTVSHKSEYTPHISAKKMYIFLRDNTIEIKLEYILE